MKKEKLYEAFEGMVDEMVPYLRKMSGKLPPLKYYWIDENKYPIFSLLETNDGKHIFTINGQVSDFIKSSLKLDEDTMSEFFTRWIKERFKIETTNIYFI